MNHIFSQRIVCKEQDTFTVISAYAPHLGFKEHFFWDDFVGLTWEIPLRKNNFVGVYLNSHVESTYRAYEGLKGRYAEKLGNKKL